MHLPTGNYKFRSVPQIVLEEFKTCLEDVCQEKSTEIQQKEIDALGIPKFTVDLSERPELEFSKLTNYDKNYILAHWDDNFIKIDNYDEWEIIHN